VTPLQLGEALGVRVEVGRGDPALLGDKQAAFLPPRRDRDEVQGGGELHVDLELLLEARDDPQDSFVFGVREERVLEKPVQRRGTGVPKNRCAIFGVV
jgi:hypothetical protein